MRNRRFVLALSSGLFAGTVCAPLGAQETLRESVSSNGDQAEAASDHPSISADERFIAFESDAGNLVDGDANGLRDVFVRDRMTGTTTRVSVDSTGAEANGRSRHPALSADGRFVVFSSDASNLVPDDQNGHRDVFVHDLQTGTTERISVSTSGTEGNEASDVDALDEKGNLSISADGSIVAFTSHASDLVDGDTNSSADAFVRDRNAGTTTRISVDVSGAEHPGYCYYTATSADGRFVAFSTAAALAADDVGGHFDVYVRDRVLATLERVSVDAAGKPGDADSFEPAISADGRFVSFESDAANLVAGDSNGVRDVFVHDRSTGATELASVSADDVQGDRASWRSAISADGRFVSFSSESTTLVVSGLSENEVFLRDRFLGRTAVASLAANGDVGNGDSYLSSLSQDGRFIAFQSFSTTLVPDDTNDVGDVFLHDKGGVAHWNNYGSGFSGTSGIPELTSSSVPCLGTSVSIGVGSSSDVYTVGLFLVGLQAADVPTNKGGVLLVGPGIGFLIGLGPWGPTQLGFDVPADPALSGLHVFAQAIELDLGAAKGFSFTPGIDLQLGE